MSPQGGIAAAYEKRIESTIEEGIYRAARAEFTRPTIREDRRGGERYNFGQMSHALGDFIGELTRGERWMDSIVWAGLGRSEDELRGYSIGTPAELEDDVQGAIERTVQALSLKLGKTMGLRLRLRLAQRVRAAVEAEIAKLSARGERPRGRAQP